MTTTGWVALYIAGLCVGVLIGWRAGRGRW